MEVAPLDAVLAKHPEFSRQRFVVCHHHAAVAGCTKIFRWIKTETGELSKTADRVAVASRTDGLSAILDNVNSPRSRQRHQLLHERGLPEQMDGDYRLRARCDLLRHFRRIEVEGARVNVGENNLGAHLVNGFRRGDVSERRRDYLV